MKITKKMRNEDWEHEHLKYEMYLLEEQLRIEQEHYDYINRKPAKIIVIDKDKILENGSIKANVLPF